MKNWSRISNFSYPVFHSFNESWSFISTGSYGFSSTFPEQSGHGSLISEWKATLVTIICQLESKLFKSFIKVNIYTVIDLATSGFWENRKFMFHSSENAETRVFNVEWEVNHSCTTTSGFTRKWVIGLKIRHHSHIRTQNLICQILKSHHQPAWTFIKITKI